MSLRQFAVLPPVEPRFDVAELKFKRIEFGQVFPLANRIDDERQNDLPDEFKKSDYVRSLDFPVRVSFACGFYNKTRAAYFSRIEFAKDSTGQFQTTHGHSLPLEELIQFCRTNWAHLELFRAMQFLEQQPIWIKMERQHAEAEWIKWCLYDAEDLCYRYSRSEEERFKLERASRYGAEYEAACDELTALKKKYHDEDLNAILSIDPEALPPVEMW